MYWQSLWMSQKLNQRRNTKTPIDKLLRKMSGIFLPDLTGVVNFILACWSNGPLVRSHPCPRHQSGCGGVVCSCKAII